MSVSSPWKTTAEALAFLNHLEISLWKQVKQQGEPKQSLTVSPVKMRQTLAVSRGSQALQVVRAKESQHVCEKGLTATAHTEAHLVL